MKPFSTGLRIALAASCLIVAAGGVASMAYADGYRVGSDMAARDTAQGDAFREDARTTYRLLQPVCPMTLKRELLALYEPYLRQLSRVELRAAGTPYAAILNDERKANIAMAATVDCARADWPGVTADSIAETLKPAGPALDRMHRTLLLHPPRRR